uniref:Hpt domain-containing protein n=1 Tax=Vibrio jasicida TaxID=766224 RepID=UPI0015E3E049
VDRSQELSSFLNSVCFGDAAYALEVLNEFSYNLSELIKRENSINSKVLVEDLHKLSGSAGLMGFKTMCKELTLLESLLKERDNEVMVMICFIKLKKMMRVYVQPNIVDMTNLIITDK